jgi:hypothetical protein
MKLEPGLEAKTPTNREAAKRAYCLKHSRAKLDIGGEKKCTACMAEDRAKESNGKQD